jgi:hypothetical protein
MSRRKRNRGNKQQPRKVEIRRFIIPLAEWKRYELFKKQSEDILAEFQENWHDFSSWLSQELALIDSDFDSINSTIRKIETLLGGKQGCLPPKLAKRYERMVAEVIIEDISTGDEL